MESRVYIDKAIQNKEWYGNPIVMSVYIHLLINAVDSAISTEYGILYPGQLITSYRKLLKLKISESQAKFAIQRLIEAEDIKVSKTGRKFLISVTNYTKLLNPVDWYGRE